MDRGLIGTRIPVWGITRDDPGYMYVLKDTDRYKIGRCKNFLKRRREASTWLPDIQVVGSKPFWNICSVEQLVHVGLSQFWYSGEWFKFDGDEYEEQFLENFVAFSDDDADRNSVDFLYWMNGDGLSEFVKAKSDKRETWPKFRQEASLTRKPRA